MTSLVIIHFDFQNQQFSLYAYFKIPLLYGMGFRSCHKKRSSDNACFVYPFTMDFLLLLADSQLQNLSQIKVFCAFQKIQTHLIPTIVLLYRLTMFFHHLSSVIHPLFPLRWLLVLLKFSSSYSFFFSTIFFSRIHAVTLAFC